MTQRCTGVFLLFGSLPFFQCPLPCAFQSITGCPPPPLLRHQGLLRGSGFFSSLPFLLLLPLCCGEKCLPAQQQMGRVSLKQALKKLILHQLAPFKSPTYIDRSDIRSVRFPQFIFKRYFLGSYDSTWGKKSACRQMLLPPPSSVRN